METIAEILGKHTFFTGPPTETVRLLAGCAWNESFTPGERLFREGEDANTFYVIRAGRVALDMVLPGRGAMTIETVETNEVLGASWLFPPYKWHFDGRAVDHVRTTTFDGKCLRERCESDPPLGYELMKRLGLTLHYRLQAARLRLLDLYGGGRHL